MSLASITRYFQWQEQGRRPKSKRSKRRKLRGTSLVLERLESRETPSVTITGLNARYFANENQTLTVDFTVSDGAIPPGNISVSATSSNTGLVANSNLFVSANGSARELTIVPTANLVGEADITINATDSNGTTTVTVPVLVNTTETIGFTDNFNQSFASFLGVGFLEEAGSFSVANNLATAAATSGSNVDLGVVNGLVTGNADVSANVNITAATGDTAGVVARYNGSGTANASMYIGELINTGAGFTAEIISDVGGSQTVLDMATNVSATGNDRIELDVVGNSLKLFVDGNLDASVTDNSIRAPGSVGFVASGTGVTISSFSIPFSDNFSVNGQLGSNWNIQLGNFLVNNGSAQGSASLDIATAANLTAPNVNLTANVNVSGGGIAGLVARYSGTGDTNMYWGGLVNTSSGVQAQIWVDLNGNWKELAGANVSVSGSTPIDFQVEGSTLQLSVNGAVAVTASDSSLTTGAVGMRVTGGATVSSFQATTISLNTVTLPFSENFSTSTNGQLSANWLNEVGSFSVSTVNRLATGVGSLDVAALNGVNQANVDLKVNVNVSAGGIAGLIARYSGTGDVNMYWAGLVNTSSGVQAQIWANVNGNWRELAGANVGVGGSTPIEFIVNGSSLQLFVNNNLAVYAYDTSLASGTVGIRTTAGASVSNFSANVQPQTVVTLPFTETFNATANGQLSTNWLNEAGDFTVSSNMAIGNGGLDVAVFNGINQANVDVSAYVNVAGSNGIAGLVARYSGTGDVNMYWGGLVNTNSGVQAQIWVNVNGNWRELAAAGVNASGSTPIEFIVNGSSLQLKVNGNMAVSTIDSELVSGTVGIRTTNGSTVASFFAGVVNQVNVGLPFSDNFSANGSLSSNWSVNIGTMSVASGTVSGGTNINVATVNGVTASDVSDQANVNVSGGVGEVAGLALRYSGPGDQNMYVGQLQNTNAGVVASIWVNVNGQWTPLTSANIGAASSGTLMFEAQGSSLRLFLNGNLVAFTNDTTFTSGSVGIRLTPGATEAAFSAQAQPLINVTLPFSDNFNTAVKGQLSASWLNDIGNFEVSANAATGFSAGANIATLNGVSVANSTVTANVNVAANGSAGLVSRFSGPGNENYYLAQIVSVGAGFQAQLLSNINGTLAPLANTAVASGSGTLELITAGSTLEVLFNGSPVIPSITNTGITAAGSVGMHASAGSSISAFSATSP